MTDKDSGRQDQPDKSGVWEGMMQVKWITEGFAGFRRGTFGNGGQNLYVSKQGVLQRIYQYDLNRDGYFDLVFANCQNHHESAPSFIYTLAGDRRELPGQGALCGMAVDIDGDGYQDVVVTGHHDMAAPFASTDIYFGSPQGYSENYRIRIPTPYAVDCCSGDFNGSGKPSLAFAMPNYKTVRVFYQTELGLEWEGFVDLPVEADLITATDLDGDGFCDLITRKKDDTATVVYWGGSDGIRMDRKTVLPALSASEILQLEEEKILQSDMERNFPAPRLLQTLVWNSRSCFTLSTGKKLMFYTGTATRTLERILELDVPMALAVAVGDIDGDGFDDLAVASQVRNPQDVHRQTSFIIWNGPDGFDRRPRQVIDTHQACDVDVNNESVLFCQCNSGRSYTNDALLFTYPDFDNPRKFISEDARRCQFLKNPDSTRIFILNHYARSSVGFDENYVYWGSADGFSPDNRLEVPGHCAVDALCADFDDDGWAELLIANNSENSLHLDVGHHIHHFGASGFEPDRTRTLCTDIGWGVVTGDFNHDGYLEIVTPCRQWTMLRIYYGRDEFQTWDDIPLDNLGSARWLYAVDVNCDGWLDLVVPLISAGRSLILWGGPEGFTIENSQKLAVRHGAGACAADLTHNGWPDIIIGGHTDTPKDGELAPHQPHHSFVYIYWNGPEGLSESRKCVLRGDAADSFAIADYNNDGYLDIFAGSYHGGKDRDIPSFLYWNREGSFRELDRTLLFTHSASGCVAADFNEDGFVDLAIANHKVDGDHQGYSSVWYNSSSGFSSERRIDLPTNGPHGMITVDPGNILTRGDEEFYYSEIYRVTSESRIVSVSIEGEIPSKTSAELRFSVNGGAWREKDEIILHAGDQLVYRLALKAKNSLRTPRITKITIEFEEVLIMSMIERIICPTSKNNLRNSEGSMVVLGNGHYLFAYSHFYGGADDSASAKILAITTKDGGKTWSEPRILQDNMGGLNVMSAGLFKLSSGKILFTFIQKNSETECNQLVRISNDGEVFNNPVNAKVWPGYGGAVNDSVLQLSTGRILIPIGFNAIATVVYSDDGGVTWHGSDSFISCPRRGAMEPVCLEQKDGRVLMFIRTQMGRIYQSFSRDWGKSWSSAEPSSVTGPEAPCAIRRIPSTGDILLVWNNNYFQGADHQGLRNPLTTAISKDDGNTFILARNIEEEKGCTYSYPSIAFDGDNVLLTYYISKLTSSLGNAASGNTISIKFKSIPLGWIYGDQS